MDRIVLPLQDGQKVAVPITGLDEKCVVVPLQTGERVAVPIRPLSVGDRVVVIPLQDGRKVAVPLSAHRDGYGEIWIHIGTVPAGPYQYVSVKFHAKTNMGSGKWGSVVYSLDGVDTVREFEVNYPSSWGQTVMSATNFGSFAESHDVWIGIRINTFAQSYYRIDNILFGVGFNSGQLLPDGDFESGSFGDGETQWEKAGDVRIISTDAYTGSYCAEFFGL